MRSFFKVEQNEQKEWELAFTPTFYDTMLPYYRGDSYWNVVYRLFGLLPQDFYHYCGYTYKALFRPSTNIRYVYMYWTDKEGAGTLCRELNRRMEVALNEKQAN